jgi:hypothetical protein
MRSTDRCRTLREGAWRRTGSWPRWLAVQFGRAASPPGHERGAAACWRRRSQRWAFWREVPAGGRPQRGWCLVEQTDRTVGPRSISSTSRRCERMAVPPGGDHDLPSGTQPRGGSMESERVTRAEDSLAAGRRESALALLVERPHLLIGGQGRVERLNKLVDLAPGDRRQEPVVGDVGERPHTHAAQ